MSDPMLRVVGQRPLLDAVIEVLGGQDPAEPETWRVVPHQGGPGNRSLPTILLDNCLLPYPEFGEPANDSDPGSTDFEDFLRAQAVVLTPPAKAYLARLSHAGPGERPVHERHEAALRAVLDVAANNAEVLTADVGPLPDGTAWIDLLDPALLQEFLTADDEDDL